MEDSWVKPDKKEHIFLYEKFREICPYFMSIGMTYEEFWKEDVTLTKYYLKSYKMKMERDVEIQQWNIWKQGVYVYEALCDVSPILHAFAKKGTKPLPFPDKPYGIEKQEEENKEPTKQEVENERLKAQVFFSNWARATKKHFNNKER